jgi:predicted aspartyl protease
MSAKGANDGSKFSVEFEVANDEDLTLAKHGHLPANQVRRQKIPGVVDTGAAMLVLPQAVVKALGLPLGDKIKVRYADDRRGERRQAEKAHVEIQGRHATFLAIVEPKRKDALIGAIVLEQLDLLADCQRQRLIPRDPKGPMFEIE